jgi:hypothetical protein
MPSLPSSSRLISSPWKMASSRECPDRHREALMSDIALALRAITSLRVQY